MRTLPSDRRRPVSLEEGLSFGHGGGSRWAALAGRVPQAGRRAERENRDRRRRYESQFYKNHHYLIISSQKYNGRLLCFFIFSFCVQPLDHAAAVLVQPQ